MRCSKCGGYVEWKGPLSNTECASCGGINCQEVEAGPVKDQADLPMICPVTSSPCTTEQDEFCQDYGCARKAGIDVDRDLIA